MENIKEYLPTIAVTISFIALIIAIINLTIAKNSYNVNKQQLINKIANFDIYLIDNYCINIYEQRLLLFHITITNRAETKNSFSPTLLLEYYNNDGFSTKIKLQHYPELSLKVAEHNFAFFQKEIFLNDKESVSKWLIFEYSSEITKQKRIDNYTLNLRDVNGNQVEITTVLMKELL